MMKRILSAITVLVLFACVACGGGGGAGTGNDNLTAALGPEKGANVLGAKYLAAGTAYAMIKSLMAGGRAMFFDIGENFSESQVGQGDISGSFSDWPYSEVLETAGLEGTISANYIYNLTQGSGPDSVVLTYKNAVHVHNGVGYFGNLSFNIGEDSFSGWMQYTNQLSSDITGNMTGSMELLVIDINEGPNFISVSGESNVTVDMLLVALDPLDGTPYYTGAVYPAAAGASMSIIYEGSNKFRYDLANMSATVKFYLNPPTGGVDDVNQLAPENNESETYTCSNISASMLFSIEDGAEDFTFGSDIHCTCSTCN